MKIDFKMRRWGDVSDRYWLFRSDADVVITVSKHQMAVLEDLPVFELAVQAQKWLDSDSTLALVWDSSDAEHPPLSILPGPVSGWFSVRVNVTDEFDGEEILGEVGVDSLRDCLVDLIHAVRLAFSDKPLSRDQRALRAIV